MKISGSRISDAATDSTLVKMTGTDVSRISYDEVTESTVKMRCRDVNRISDDEAIDSTGKTKRVGEGYADLR